MIRQWLTVKVAARQVEATDIVSFELVDPAGGTLPPFTAGAHVDVEVKDGLIRQYSLCNHPDHHGYQIAVLRDSQSRGGSQTVCDEFKEGQLIRISEPKNHFPLATNAAHSLLIAGGIGITPVLCMAERLAHAKASFQMHYCTKSQERTAFYDRIKNSTFADRVSFHFSSQQRMDLNRTLANPAPGTHLYVCGPAHFMNAVLVTAKAWGWPDAQVHREYFNATEQEGAVNDEFIVRLASSGHEFTIPADKSITTVLMKHGVDIPVSCEQGVCGTCLTHVLEGTPDHRDMFLTDDERARNDQFLPCCSRSKSKVLVLDI